MNQQHKSLPPWLTGDNKKTAKSIGPAVMDSLPQNTLYDTNPGLATVSDPTAFVDPDSWTTKDGNPNWAMLSAPFIAAGIAKLTGRDAAESFNKFVNIGRGLMAGQEAAMKRNLAQRKAAMEYGLDIAQERREWARYQLEANKESNRTKEAERKKLLEAISSMAPYSIKGTSKLLKDYWRKHLGIDLSDDAAMGMASNIAQQKKNDEFIKVYEKLDSATEKFEYLMNNFVTIYGDDRKAFDRITAAADAEYWKNKASQQKSQTELLEGKNAAIEADAYNKFLTSEDGQSYMLLENMKKLKEVELANLEKDFEINNYEKNEKIKKVQNALMRVFRLQFESIGASSNQTWGVAAGQAPNGSKIYDAVNAQFTGSPSENSTAIDSIFSQIGDMGIKTRDELNKLLAMSWTEIKRTNPKVLELKDGGALRFQDVMLGLYIPEETWDQARKEMGVGGDKIFDTPQDVAMDIKKTVDQELLDRHPERMARMSSGDANSEDRAVLAQERNNIITAIINKQKWGDEQKGNVMKWLDEAYAEKQQAPPPQEEQKTQEDTSPFLAATQDQTRTQGQTKRMSSFPESIPSERIPKPPLRPQNSNSPGVEMKSPEFVTKDDGSTTAMMRARNGRIATEFMSDFIQGKKTSEEDIKDFLKAINSGVVDIKSIDEGLLQRFMDAYNKGN